MRPSKAKTFSNCSLQHTQFLVHRKQSVDEYEELKMQNLWKIIFKYTYLILQFKQGFISGFLTYYLNCSFSRGCTNKGAYLLVNTEYYTPPQENRSIQYIVHSLGFKNISVADSEDIGYRYPQTQTGIPLRIYLLLIKFHGKFLRETRQSLNASFI